MFKKNITIPMIFLIVTLNENAMAQQATDTLEHRLRNALSAFAATNAVSSLDMENLIGKIVLDDNKYRKGGIGIITKNVFVILDEKRNAIMINGKKWEGEVSSKAEVVLTDGTRIISPSNVENTNKIIIIVFIPNEVRYINLMEKAGGIYKRYP